MGQRFHLRNCSALPKETSTDFTDSHRWGERHNCHVVAKRLCQQFCNCLRCCAFHTISRALPLLYPSPGSPPRMRGGDGGRVDATWVITKGSAGQNVPILLSSRSGQVITQFFFEVQCLGAALPKNARTTVTSMSARRGGSLPRWARLPAPPAARKPTPASRQSGRLPAGRRCDKGE